MQKNTSKQDVLNVLLRSIKFYLRRDPTRYKKRIPYATKLNSISIYESIINFVVISQTYRMIIVDLFRHDRKYNSRYACFNKMEINVFIKKRYN